MKADPDHELREQHDEAEGQNLQRNEGDDACLKVLQGDVFRKVDGHHDGESCRFLGVAHVEAEVKPGHDAGEHGTGRGGNETDATSTSSGKRVMCRFLFSLMHATV